MAPAAIMVSVPAPTNNTTLYEVVLVGNGGVGKTTYIKRLIIDEYEHKYVATLRVEIHSLRFITTHGDTIFGTWDTTGVFKFGGLRDGYYYAADCAIVMYEAANTTEQIQQWITALLPHTQNIILVRNKLDLGGENSPLAEVYPHFAISTKDGSINSLAEPYLHHIRTLRGGGDENIQFQ
jgi:small GTP-binding protein